MTRNPSLDAVRAAAIGLVLACHLSTAFAAGSTFTAFAGTGGRGVDLFFVLSGYLLGGQLFRELDRTGTVAVKRFWVRRWLRTLPAYYAVLFATWAHLAATGKYEKIGWQYLVFVQNYMEHPLTLGITWSLCVEEHFYLVIAPAVALAWRSRVATGLLFALVGVFVVRHALGLYSPKTEHGQTPVSHVLFEQCLMGVMLGWAEVRKPAAWAAVARFAPAFLLFGVAAFVVAACNRGVWDFVLPDYGVGGWGVVAACVVFAAAVRPTREVRIVSFVAARAFSLYLAHTDALVAAKKLTALPPAAQAAAAVALAFGMAEVLYRVVEVPFMRLRPK